MIDQKPFSEKEIGPADAQECGLSLEEYRDICRILKRAPTPTELGIYSALWSEHCSYKNSIALIKTLPSQSPRSLTLAGEENAGALDIGDGLALVFKIESHNHPTAIEPYQGAATGVGGIMRDIFTMGARPLCSLNSLRFGYPHSSPDSFSPKDHKRYLLSRAIRPQAKTAEQENRNRYLLSQAVKGIGDYGNSLGIPVMGGELFFDPSFGRNCLVNAMAVGVARHEDLAFARAEGVGNPVYIVGASTGRDGIHGAAFASQDLSQESEERRSAVQVGDPFLEKLVMEATLELLKDDLVVGIQDMGAAGLSCASAEMSAKGNVGMELDLDKVPLREDGMSAYEIMLSESQERMLVVAHSGPKEEAKLKEIFSRWELSATKIGRVSDDGKLRIFHKGKLHAEIPAESLVLGGGAPRYKRESARPAYLDEIQSLSLQDIPKTKDRDLSHTFLELVGAPNLCSRRPLYEQYDSEVGLARLIGPGSHSGAARIPGTHRGLAVATDCNSRYVYLDPYKGAASAVCESARNVAVCGARPIGISNCLNFANPYVPENYYMFEQSIRGMGAACEALKIPVTGGNVSFYNESEECPIFPTPTIGMVGLLDDLDWLIPGHFQESGQDIYLVGDFNPVFGGSEYLYTLHKKTAGSPPDLELEREAALIAFLCEAAQQKLLASAGDLSLGGLALALFRSAYNAHERAGFGFCLGSNILEENLRRLGRCSGARKDLLFFGETNGTALVSADRAKQDSIQSLAHKKALPLVKIGRTQSTATLDFAFFTVSMNAALERYEQGLAEVF